jgi:hypothetical protein
MSAADLPDSAAHRLLAERHLSKQQASRDAPPNLWRPISPPTVSRPTTNRSCFIWGVIDGSR